jgi:hypothetical protein
VIGLILADDDDDDYLAARLPKPKRKKGKNVEGLAARVI